MYSPLRARLGPKPTSGAPRSPSRSPQGPESPIHQYVSPYRAPSLQQSKVNPSPSNKLFTRFGVSPLNATAIGTVGDDNSDQVLSSTGTPLRGGAVAAAGSPASSPLGSLAPSTRGQMAQNRIGTVPQGGAVGLWRVARDGHSPMGHAGGEDETMASNQPQRPSTQGANDRTGQAGGRIGTANLTSVVSNVTSAPLLNMSLDEALMGGLLKEAKQGLNANLVPARPSPFARTGSVPTTPSKRPSIPTAKAPTSPTGGFFRSASATTHMLTAIKTSYLIPPLQLPTHQRQVSQTAEGTPAEATTTEARPGWITVVFDLDETLCNNRLPGKACMRPGCMELLNSLAAIRDDYANSHCFVEIILWTASMECVARPVVERMDPLGTVFNHLIYRDRRWYKENGYTKDLRLLGRDLSHVVIIENSPMSVVLNRNHSILVKDFVGGGSYNHYYGGGALNTRTSTGSLSDPSLFIVSKVLTEWAQAVGRHAEESLATPPAVAPPSAMAKPTPAPHHPAFVSLPMPIGIVEFLRASPDISHTNDVVLNGANVPRGSISGINGAACGSPVKAIPRASVLSTRNSWGVVSSVASPTRSLTASPGRVTRYR